MDKIENLPVLMSAKDIQAVGFTRSMAYAFLNRTDVPVIRVGGRKFIRREKFMEWLDSQENQKPEGGIE